MFDVVTKFENKIAEFFGSTYAVAVDCCTHGVELCLRYTEAKQINCPVRTYISIPFLSKKLNLKLQWDNDVWKDYYYVTPDIIDAAVLWKKDSYIPNTYMCISFQFQKHLSLGRGGIILTDDKQSAIDLKRLSYDGRHPDIPWREQDIDMIGYHYYMNPEIAQIGLDKFDKAVDTPPREWKYEDWPDLTTMKIFK
jgi:dTDP-4-amino-4,6-dideoxygalactose transaminase